jgi:hypothetical protein
LEEKSMNFFTIIISLVAFITIGFVLYIYSVHRARFLVRQQLESISKNIAEDEKIKDVEYTHHNVGTVKNSEDTQADDKIKPYKERPNIQEKPLIPSNKRRWATLN